MKKLSLTIGILVAAITLTSAQDNHFEIELDPLAYALGGGSGHVAYAFKNERIQLGFGMLDLPEGMQNHEGISESFKAISLKWDYFFGREDATQGFFAGPTFDYLFLTYDDGQDQFEENQLALGIRAGYKIDLFKNSYKLSGLYLTPWMGASVFTNPGDIAVGDQTYSRKAVTFFPTVHLGWSF